MSEIGQRPPPYKAEFESSELKHRAESELLVKLGAKEEEFDWHPDILYRRPERPRSSISLDYPLDLKVGRPKTAGAIQNRNPWVCDNPALRQMTLVSQSNSYRKALVTYPSLTDYMCACTPTNAPVKYYLWLINHNEFYFCEQNARFSQLRKEPPIIVYKNRIINHVTITMELI